MDFLTVELVGTVILVVIAYHAGKYAQRMQDFRERNRREYDAAYRRRHGSGDSPRP